MTIKIRSMETNYFVLCRFFLRVDRVIVRVHDCRLYSEEGWNYMLRECSVREAPYEKIAKEVLLFLFEMLIYFLAHSSGH